ncbi:MAG: hypothetical protein NTV97_24990 [Alphaproteobacteria bacterium]|nr:hypothetical protein [Alphaproteobacteria bacterium]
MQKVTTTGNATMVVYDDKPLLVTDPWFGDEEPAYFGSWTLSHRIPKGLKDDIALCDYVFFSHGHPDHLNPTRIERFRGKQILLPDHVNARIFNDLKPGGYDLTILPDRTWVPLSKNVKVQAVTTQIQDAILLVDGTRSCWSTSAAAFSSTSTMPARATARATSAASPAATSGRTCWRSPATATPT